ncbi:MAG: hypothetical protein FWE02_03705 [Defluviitaleaceae bacterium]|nr:hypothetical protein [Defluviitaleaceae bacterium]
MMSGNRGIKRSSSSKNTEDFFITSNETIDILYNSIYRDRLNVNPNAIVADFACGDGAILNRFKALAPAISIYGNDIIARIDDENIGNYSALDALAVNATLNEFDSSKDIHLVFNPPFNKSIDILNMWSEIYKHYASVKTMSILMPLRAIEGSSRYKIFERLKPTTILNMMFRPTFWIKEDDHTSADAELIFIRNDVKMMKPYKAYFSCVWVVWDKKSNNNETTMKFLWK